MFSIHSKRVTVVPKDERSSQTSKSSKASYSNTISPLMTFNRFLHLSRNFRFWKSSITNSSNLLTKKVFQGDVTSDDVLSVHPVLQSFSCKHIQRAYHRHVSFHVSSNHVVWQMQHHNYHIHMVDLINVSEYGIECYTFSQNVSHSWGIDIRIYDLEDWDRRYNLP